MKGTPVTEETYQYICSLFPAEDEFLRTLNKEAAEQDIPPINISPEQLAFIQVMLRAMNARYILEVGSLAGYSAIGMARVLPDDGKLVCLELQPHLVDFVRRKVEEAGLSHKVEVLQGDAMQTLQHYKPDFLFDFVFIDADKENYANYLSLTLPLLRQGGIVCGDNALAWGKVADSESTEPQVVGIRNFNQALSTNSNLQGCIVPVGDGMAMGLKRS